MVVKKLKVTAVQKHQLQLAHANSAQVLREIKRLSLDGEALRHMKCLEGAVQNLEVLVLLPTGK